MKVSFLILPLLVSFCATLNAQSPSPSPSPTALEELGKIVLAPVVKTNSKILAKYDRFSDTTSVSVDVILGVAGLIDLGGGSVYAPPGADLRSLVLTVNGLITGTNLQKANPSVSLSFVSQSTEWRYLTGPNTLRVILDGHERIFVGDMKRTYDKVLDGRHVVEQLAMVDVPFSILEKLSRASKIEMQLASDEFELKPNQINDLKDWVNHFPAAKSKPQQSTTKD